MNAQQNAPISDGFSSLCARVFSPAAAILESEKTLGTRLVYILSWSRGVRHVVITNEAEWLWGVLWGR